MNTPAENREWVRRQVEQYARLRPRYKTFARTLDELLSRASEIHAPLAIVRSRPKTIPSFAEKIQRKQAQYPSPYDPVNQFTDLCGARVVTVKRAHVYAMCEFIEEHFDVAWDDSADMARYLQPTEFGYRSVHYIVSFRKGVFPTEHVPVEIPAELFPDSDSPMRAEIQVRTVLEHGWADVVHDLSYKSAFKVPRKFEREIARVAALLEDADSDFERIHDELQRYAADYGGYLTPPQLDREIELLGIVLEYDSDNFELVRRLGKLLMTRGDWEAAERVMSPHEQSGSPALLRDLGVVRCKLHRHDPQGHAYRRGQALLERAATLAPDDADAVASLAGTWRGHDDDRACELYRRAYAIDPANPYPLGNYLVYEIVRQRSTHVVGLMAPALREAVRRCRDQASVNMNMPWAYFDLGKFELLLGHSYESLAAYARAVRVSLGDGPIDNALATVEALREQVADSLPAVEWIYRFLLVARAAKLMESADGRPLKAEKQQRLERALAVLCADDRLATPGARPIQGPVVIVVGGTDRAVDEQMRSYRELLVEGFGAFEGTLISGGTTAGICGLVGDLAVAYPASITTIGYLPQTLPEHVSIDSRYSEIRRTSGGELTPLEPLQNWIDLIASGIEPRRVRVLGIGGGPIAAAEYRVALALGARLAILQRSGREAAKLLSDEDWALSANLFRLPADPMTLRAFVGGAAPQLPVGTREVLARAVNEEYRRNRSAVLRKELAEWQDLSGTFRESSAQQADHIAQKLRHIGCEIHEVRDREPALMKFSDREVEAMAEMEHGRWNAERLLDGWKWGPEKNVDEKISPYLVTWRDLPEDMREMDRRTVRAIPRYLAEVGLEIRRTPG